MPYNTRTPRTLHRPESPVEPYMMDLTLNGTERNGKERVVSDPPSVVNLNDETETSDPLGEGEKSQYERNQRDHTW